MIRRPRPPPRVSDAFYALTLPKILDDTPQDVLREARAREGWIRGNTEDTEDNEIDWQIGVWMRGAGILKALLKVNGAPIVGLDWHEGPMSVQRGGLPRGYHWDIYEPFVIPPPRFPRDVKPYHERVHAEGPDKSRPFDALDLARQRMAIFLSTERQRRLPNG